MKEKIEKVMNLFSDFNFPKIEEIEKCDFLTIWTEEYLKTNLTGNKSAVKLISLSTLEEYFFFGTAYSNKIEMKPLFIYPINSTFTEIAKIILKKLYLDELIKHLNKEKDGTKYLSIYKQENKLISLYPILETKYLPVKNLFARYDLRGGKKIAPLRNNYANN